METVEDRRSREVYSHELCTLACQKRGCGRLYVADGCWKLHYPICMYTAKSLSKGIEDYIPHDCPKSPRYGKAFCNEHCRVIESLGVPTDLRPFIKYCGADPVNYNKEEKKKVDEKLKELGQLGDTGLPVSEVQGTSFLFKNETFKVKIQLSLYASCHIFPIISIYDTPIYPRVRQNTKVLVENPHTLILEPFQLWIPKCPIFFKIGF